MTTATDVHALGVRRHRGALAAGVLASLAIVAGVAGTVWQAQRAQQAALVAEQHARRAERGKQNAPADLEDSEAMLNLMQALVGAVTDKPVLPADLVDTGRPRARPGVGLVSAASSPWAWSRCRHARASARA